MQYTYSKYNVTDTRLYKEQDTWTDLGQVGSYDTNQARITDRQYRPSYTFDSKTGLFSPSTAWTWGQGNNGLYYYCGPVTDFYSLWQGAPVTRITRFTFRWTWPDANNILRVFGGTNTAVYVSGDVIKGDLLGKVVADDGTYPDNGYRASDGFWYVKNTIVSEVSIVSVNTTHVYNNSVDVSLKMTPPVDVSYKAILNAISFKDYGSILQSLGSATINIPNVNLNNGSNSIVLTCKDSEGTERSVSTSIIKEEQYRNKVERTFTAIDGGYILNNVILDGVAKPIN